MENSTNPQNTAIHRDVDFSQVSSRLLSTQIICKNHSNLFGDKGKMKKEGRMKIRGKIEKKKKILYISAILLHYTTARIRKISSSCRRRYIVGRISPMTMMMMMMMVIVGLTTSQPGAPGLLIFE